MRQFNKLNLNKVKTPIAPLNLTSPEKQQVKEQFRQMAEATRNSVKNKPPQARAPKITAPKAIVTRKPKV
jgi:hypothetical protein